MLRDTEMVMYISKLYAFHYVGRKRILRFQCHLPGRQIYKVQILVTAASVPDNRRGTWRCPQSARRRYGSLSPAASTFQCVRNLRFLGGSEE